MRYVVVHTPERVPTHVVQTRWRVIIECKRHTCKYVNRLRWLWKTVLQTERIYFFFIT